MKIINTATNETLAEITTNHSMSIDDVIELMGWTMDEDGNLFDESGNIGHYDDLKMIY